MFSGKTLRLGLVASLCVFSLDAEEKKDAAKKIPKAPSSASSGLKAFIDPVTKELRPMQQGEVISSSELQSTTPATPVQITTRPDGIQVLKANPGVRIDAVAIRNPDGTFSINCAPADQLPISAKRKAEPDVQ